jgi:hypothetical protein
MRDVVQVAFEASGLPGIGKVAGTISVSSSLIKTDSSVVDIVKEFIKRQYKVEAGEVKAAVLENEQKS